MATNPLRGLPAVSDHDDLVVLAATIADALDRRRSQRFPIWIQLLLVGLVFLSLAVSGFAWYVAKTARTETRVLEQTYWEDPKDKLGGD